MALTNKEVMEIVNDTHNRQRVADDSDRFIVYNGKLKEVIKRAISKEFSKPETVKQLFDRIVPINITQKIVDKLAAIYIQPPSRTASDKNQADQELIDLYSNSFKMNRNGKLANRYFKLHKHTLWQPFLDRDGIPKLRTLPSQTYTPLSEDRREPDRPTMIVKHLKFDPEPERQRHEIWTDETFQIVDGNGAIDIQRMNELDNPEGINPFGRLPFVYVSDNTDGNLIPISDDDLISMQLVISVLLTDLTFASKYQLWSVIVAKGVNTNASFDWNPNSIIKVPPGVDIEAIKPKLDTMEALNLIKSLVGMLLTTKNLSVGSMQVDVDRSDPASGTAKMIDKSETTEDRLDQEQIFRDSETQLWDLFAHHMLPTWVDSGEIHPDYVGRFSESFQLSIRFADQKPVVSDQQVVDTEIKKLNEGLTTKKMALGEIFPELDNEELDDLLASIGKEKEESALRMMKVMGRSQLPQGDEEDGPETEV